MARRVIRLRTLAFKRRRRSPARGFSLLEVIVAIAILAGAVAVLGELARQGMESTRMARDTTRALLLCESLIDEIASGAIDPQREQGKPCEDATPSGGPAWLYSVELNNVGVDGLVGVTVTVYQDLPEESGPIQCSLTRWIVDPGVEFYVPEEDSSTESSGTTTGTTSSTGTGNG